jgi:hypothetical protein
MKISPGSLPKKGILNLENKNIPKPRTKKNNPIKIKNFPIPVTT